MATFCIIELSAGHCQEKTSIWISNADGHKWPQSKMIPYSTSVRTKRASGVGAAVICICLFVLKKHVTDEQVRLEVSPGNSVLLKTVCSRGEGASLQSSTMQGFRTRQHSSRSTSFDFQAF